MRQPSRFAVVVGLLVTCIGSTATAQSVVTDAITGTLTDSSKKTTQTVDVLARNIDTKREASGTTEDEGRFRIVGLQPGHYIIEVNASGLKSLQVANVAVEVGRTTTVDISLDSALASSGPAPSGMSAINTTAQGFSLNLTQASFDDLPNNGRRWSTFASLAAATAPDGPSGAASFRGISSLLNNNTIDGGDNDQAFSAYERGGTHIGYGIGLASIREVHIDISNYSAEHGGATGGVINAVTKSGTNTFRGSALLFDRDNKWGARNPRGFQDVSIDGVPALVALKPVDTRYQFGGAIGGPVVENRLFFFASHDQQRRNFPAVSTTSDPGYFDTVDRGTTGAGLKAPTRALTDAQIDSALAFLKNLTGEVPRRGDQTIYTPRVDWHLTSRHALSATYNRLRWNSPAGIDTAPTINTGRTSVGDDFVDIDWIAVGVMSMMSSRVVNELRGQFGRDHEFQFSQMLTVLSAAYLFSAGRDLPTFIDVNLPAPTSRTYTVIDGQFNGQTVVGPVSGSPGAGMPAMPSTLARYCNARMSFNFSASRFLRGGTCHVGDPRQLVDTLDKCIWGTMCRQRQQWPDACRLTLRGTSRRYQWGAASLPEVLDTELLGVAGTNHSPSPKKLLVTRVPRRWIGG
jgi:Carboxypeptidase regulatory-like domain